MIDCLLTVPGSGALNSLAFHKGLGGQTYDPVAVVTVDAIQTGVSGLAVDLSGDGCADLVITRYTTAQQPSVGYVRSMCDGTFGPIPSPAPYPGGVPLNIVINQAFSMEVLADFNGDGRVDILYGVYSVGDQGRAVSWITLADVGNPPLPGLTRKDTSAGFICGANGWLGGVMALRDFNNDGKQDMMVALDYQGLTQSSAYTEAVVALGDGQGGFTQTIPALATKGGASGTTTALHGASFGDFNNDGNLDMAATTTAPQIFYGDGAGNFSTTPP